MRRPAATWREARATTSRTTSPFSIFPRRRTCTTFAPVIRHQIGKTDQANHQYDLDDFLTALDEGELPAVSYLKAKGAFDGHAGYSDPVDEQTFLVQTINRLQRSPEWRHLAIVIAYDDSDGWYDHAMDPVVNQSDVSDDNLTGPGACGALPRRHTRTLRLRPPASASGDLAVRERKLRRPQDHRPNFHPAVHRGQLGSGPTR